MFIEFISLIIYFLLASSILHATDYSYSQDKHNSLKELGFILLFYILFNLKTK